MRMTEYHERLAKIGGVILFIIGIFLLFVAVLLWVMDNTHIIVAGTVLIVALELVMGGSMGLLIYFFKIRKKAPNAEYK